MGTPKSPRQILLEEAIKITTADRNKSYGAPEDNFKNIAGLWNEYLRAKETAYSDVSRVRKLTSADVANFMILMKVARLSTNPGHRDSALDVAGYAACLADIQESINRTTRTKPEGDKEPAPVYNSTYDPRN